MGVAGIRTRPCPSTGGRPIGGGWAILAPDGDALGRRAGGLPRSRGQGLPERRRPRRSRRARCARRSTASTASSRTRATAAGTRGSSGARRSRRMVARFIGAAAGRDRLRPEHLDRHQPDRRPARGGRAGPLGRAGVPGRDAALDPPRGPGALRARRGGRAAARVLRRGPGPARRDDRDQPRAVLERLPPGPRRLRPHQGPAAPRGVRQPVGGGLPGRREEEPHRRPRHAPATSGCAPATGPASAT